MSARIPLDPEPWVWEVLGYPPERTAEKDRARVDEDWFYRPREVIFASTNPATLDLRCPVCAMEPGSPAFEEYHDAHCEGRFPTPTHPANRILVDFRESGLSAGHWVSALTLGNLDSIHTLFARVHARAVLSRLTNIDWKEWRA